MQQCDHHSFTHGVGPFDLPCALVAGLDRVEVTRTIHEDGDPYYEQKVVFNVVVDNPHTWLLRMRGIDGSEYVITSILASSWDDKRPSYTAKGRKLTKDGTAFRSRYSEYLGYIGTSFFGEDVS